MALPPILVAASELTELDAPAADQAQIEAIAEGLEEAVEKAEADPLSVSAASKNDPFDEVNKAAAAFGFKACSSLA